MQVILELYLCSIFFNLQILDVVFHLFVASFKFLDLCLKFTDQVFEIVVVFLFLSELVDEIELLLLGILVAVKQ